MGHQEGVQNLRLCDILAKATRLFGRQTSPLRQLRVSEAGKTTQQQKAARSLFSVGFSPVAEKTKSPLVKSDHAGSDRNLQYKKSYMRKSRLHHRPITGKRDRTKMQTAAQARSKVPSRRRCVDPQGLRCGQNATQDSAPKRGRISKPGGKTWIAARKISLTTAENEPGQR